MSAKTNFVVCFDRPTNQNKKFHEKKSFGVLFTKQKLFLNMSNKCHINNIFFFLSWLTVKVREETLPILRITKTSLWVTNICRAKFILIHDEICRFNSYHEKYMIKFLSLNKMIFKIKYIIYDTTLHNMSSSRYIKVTLRTKNEVGGH